MFLSHTLTLLLLSLSTFEFNRPAALSLSKFAMSKRANKRKAKQDEQPKQRKKRSTTIKPAEHEEYFEDQRNLVLLHPNFQFQPFILFIIMSLC